MIKKTKSKLFPFLEAGNAFIKAADLHLQQNNKHDGGTLYVDASNCFKKVDPGKAIKCLEKTIELFQDMGRFTTAAKHHISIAEIYESDLVDLEKTVLHYQTAADYYQGEESKASANRCLLKVAQYSALNGDFLKVGVIECSKLVINWYTNPLSISTPPPSPVCGNLRTRRQLLHRIAAAEVLCEGALLPRRPLPPVHRPSGLLDLT